eukprot:gene18418-24122_t
MIPTLHWIPKGAALSRPIKFEASPEEYARVLKLAKEEQERLAESNESVDKNEFNDLPDELDMNNYDNDDIDRDIVIDENDIEDQYEVMEYGDKAFGIEADSEDEDAEDDQIKDTDTLLIVAITEDDYSHLEIQLLSDDGCIYVHHDIALPEFPLCLAWCDCPPFRSPNDSQINTGNYVAVGTFDPVIEIWNLDVLDPLEPSASLGGIDKNNSKSKKKSKVSYLPGSHTEAVMSLSWNSIYRQAMASGSADTTVKIWDITTQQCSHTFTDHKDKVQVVNFHPQQAWLLSSGSFDKSIRLYDCRNGNITNNYTVSADLEAMTWDPHNENLLFAALENGVISCIDIRQLNEVMYSFQAHNKTTTSISFSHSIPGMLATASTDKTIRIWDTLNSSESNLPKQIAYKSMNVGKLFTVQFYPNSPYLLATAGDKGTVAIWESDEQQVIADYFNNRLVESKQPVYKESSFTSDTIDNTVADTMDIPIADTTNVIAEEDDNINTSTNDKKKKKKKSDKKKNK